MEVDRTVEEKLLVNLPFEYLGLQWKDDKQSLLRKTDWKFFLYISKIHRLMPIAYKVYKRYMSASQCSRFEKNVIEFDKCREAHLCAINTLCDFFADYNINIKIRKGFSFSEYIYDDMGLRVFNDIDLLINKKDIIAFFQGMVAAGWTYGYYNKKGKFIAINQLIYKDCLRHEYFEFVKEMSGYRIHIDFTDGLSYLNNDSTILFGDEESKFKKFDDTNNFIDLCMNAYQNMFSYKGRIKREASLRDMIDVFIAYYKERQKGNLEHIFLYAKQIGVIDQLRKVINSVTLLFCEGTNLLGQFQLEPDISFLSKEVIEKSTFNRISYVGTTYTEEYINVNMHEKILGNLKVNDGCIDVCSKFDEETLKVMLNISTSLLKNSNGSIFEIKLIAIDCGIIKNVDTFYAHIIDGAIHINMFRTREEFDSCAYLRNKEYFKSSNEQIIPYSQNGDIYIEYDLRTDYLSPFVMGISFNYYRVILGDIYQKYKFIVSNEKGKLNDKVH